MNKSFVLNVFEKDNSASKSDKFTFESEKLAINYFKANYDTPKYLAFIQIIQVKYICI